MNSKTTSNGIGLLLFVFLIFLTLKLGNIGVVALWPWWAVTGGLWMPTATIATVLVVYLPPRWALGKFSESMRRRRHLRAMLEGAE